MTAAAQVPRRAPLWHDVSRACAGQASPTARPVLLGRLRGLLGRQLASRLSRDDHAALFPVTGHTPSPLVPRMDGLAHRPALTIRLIGTAARWAEAVGDALTAVTDDGLIVPGGRRPLLGRGPILHQREPGALLSPTSAARVVLETPLCLADGVSLDGPALGRAATIRWYGLAPWLDPDTLAWLDPRPPPDGDWSRLRLDGPARRVTWTRIAHRQGERPVPMTGWIAAFALDHEKAAVLPWLRLAEVLHAGRHASFGLGRVRIRTPA